MLRACFTNDQELLTEPLQRTTVGAVVAYLEATPRNAVVIATPAGPRYILRGASEQPDNYYFGDYPAEDPGDASGGDLTASQAVQAVLEA